MYQKIVNAKPIMFPSSVSQEASDLITNLLRFEPHDRLGFESIDPLKSHQFFRSVDWEAMSKLQVPAPAKPIIRSEEDVAAFDSVFTSMAPAITPSDRAGPGAASMRRIFAGFTFYNEK